MLKTLWTLISVVTLTATTLGAETQAEFPKPITVAKLLQRAAESPLRAADAGLLRAVADLVEKEEIARKKFDDVASRRFTEAEDSKPPESRPDVCQDRPRKRLVFHLRNISVREVVKTIEQFLQDEIDTEDSRQRWQALLQTVLVPEPNSNSLLVSSQAGLCDEIARLVANLDARPDMVSIKVLIAEIVSIPSNQPDNAPWEFPPKEDVAAWLADAKKQGHLKVLSRPEIMTLENQEARIHIQDTAPGVRNDSAGDSQKVLLSLGVTPRIAPDGLICMDFDLQRSSNPDRPEVGVQTMVSAKDGQTVFLGGTVCTTDGKSHGLVVTATPRITAAPVVASSFR